MTDMVNHPAHYGGGDNPYEVIKVLEAWECGFHDGNAIKYIARAGKKSTDTEIQDLRKARWYLDRLIRLKEIESVKSIPGVQDPQIELRRINEDRSSKTGV